jgi:hypothetical protein
MKQLLEALDLALEALEESVDLVREDYENAKKLYSNYPSRQARLLGLEDGLSKHEAAITAIKQARSAPEEPVYHLRQFGDVTKEQLDRYMATGDINPQLAPVQEPVAWIEHHEGGDNLEWDHFGGKCTPLYTTPPAAQRQWVGLTTEDMATCIDEPAWDLILRKAEQILKEKNT